MSRTALSALKRLFEARRAQASREYKLLGGIVRALATPRNDGTPRKARSKPARTTLRKRLRCPRCDRTFAMPMHLGRHIAMSHKSRRAKAR
jgi:hypothetical protein